MTMPLNEKGQALYELIVISTLVFIPLLLALPLLVRFLDLQHRIQLSAYYLNWENTLGFNPASEPSIQRVVDRLWLRLDSPVRSLSTARAHDFQIQELDQLLQVWNPKKEAWQSFPGPLKDPDLTINSAQSAPGGLSQKLRNVVFKPLSKIGYDPNINGLFTTEMRVTFPDLAWHESFDQPYDTFHMQGKIVMLTDGWGMDTVEQANQQVASLLPSAHFAKLTDYADGLRAIDESVGGLAPWIKPISSLELGKVDSLPIPAQRLVPLQGRIP